MRKTISIDGDGLWVKVVEMLQQNWAGIEPARDGVNVHFITDTSQVFDMLAFDSITDAAVALTRNGLRRFEEAPDLQRFLRAPVPPFIEGSHTNGPICSSGRFWR